MNITCFKNFKKRNNSTKRPSMNIEGSFKNVGVILKDSNINIYTPSFLISEGNFDKSYTYIKWYNYYYYIDSYDIVNDGLYMINCSIDYLASFIGDIQATTAFVLYSASDYDIMIPDTRLSTNSEPDVSFEHKAIFTSSASDNFSIVPRYAVTYIGNQEGLNPVVYLTDEQLIALANAMQNTTFNEIFTNPENAFYRMVIDTASAVTSVIFNPIAGVVFSPHETIKLCGYDTGVQCQNGLDHYTRVIDLDIPWNYDDFRNRHEYTSLTLYLPAYGLLELNPDDLIEKEKIYVRATVDNRLGSITYLVSGSSAFREILYKCNAVASSPVQFGTIRASNVINGIVGLGASVLSTVSGNIASGIAGSFNAVNNLMQRSTGVLGSNGDMSNYYALNEVTLNAISHGTTIEPAVMREMYGRPLNQVRSLNTLSGYVQTNDANVESINSDVSTTLSNLLNGGVFLE